MSTHVSLADSGLVFEKCGRCGARIYPADHLDAHMLWHARRDGNWVVAHCKRGDHEYLTTPMMLKIGRKNCPKHIPHGSTAGMKHRKDMSGSGVEKRDVVKAR